MKILVVSDEESRSLWEHYSPKKLEGVDMIISCGDLSADYLEFLATMVKCPVLYVPGNHDYRYTEHPPGGCENIDGRIFEYNGLRIFGLGGAMKYKPGPYMYTENEMKMRILRAQPAILKHSGFDILVTHAPAAGYGDLSDLPHKGYECFNGLLCRCRPSYMLHGHVHATYGGKFRRIREHPSGTVIVNGFDKYYLDIDENNLTRIKRLELFRTPKKYL